VSACVPQYGRAPVRPPSNYPARFGLDPRPVGSLGGAGDNGMSPRPHGNEECWTLACLWGRPVWSEVNTPGRNPSGPFFVAVVVVVADEATAPNIVIEIGAFDALSRSVWMGRLETKEVRDLRLELRRSLRLGTLISYHCPNGGRGCDSPR
jgi:hypothetical protein